MTAKTFFNKGIYKATIKRLWVGSALYLVIMMLFSCFWDVTDGYYYRFEDSRYYFREQLEYSFFMSLAVSVVVAVLVFRFMHSKKNSIFIHSMPVARLSNYLSSLFAAFTLMAVPLFVQSIIYALSTGEIYYSLLWFLYSFFCDFVLMSVAVFACVLAGTTYVAVGLYIAAHFVFYFVEHIIYIFMDTFAAGYSGSWASGIANINMPNLLQNLVRNVNGRLYWGDYTETVILFAVSIVFYVLSYFLYKKRHLERTEDVAAYKSFNYILKYVVTLVGATIAFELFGDYIGKQNHIFFIGIILVSGVCYFGIEMLLKKKIKVWYTYKGYLGFLVVFGLFMLFMAKTSIFGYETYVPKVEEIDYATVSSNANGHNAIYDRASIEKLCDFHKQVIDEERKEIVSSYEDESLRICYYTNDGKSVIRWYYIPVEVKLEIMDGLYESDKFKEEYEGIFGIDENDLYGMELGFNVNVEIDEELQNQVIECIKKDIYEHSYSELYYEEVVDVVEDVSKLRINWLEEDKTVDKEMATYEGVPEGFIKRTISYRLTASFENTIEFLSRNGYTEYLGKYTTKTYNRMESPSKNEETEVYLYVE